MGWWGISVPGALARPRRTNRNRTPGRVRQRKSKEAERFGIGVSGWRNRASGEPRDRFLPASGFFSAYAFGDQRGDQRVQDGRGGSWGRADAIDRPAPRNPAAEGACRIQP